MYLTHYGLKLKPFSISPDPHFLWLGEGHKEALAMLRYGILHNKGFLLLTGDVGTGKTVLIKLLIKLIDLNVIVATIPDPSLSLIDFYNILADEFKMGRTFNQKGEFLIHFKEFLIKAYRDQKTVLLIIDEAQRLQHELLDEVRVLSNIDFNSSNLINIFLVGQSELREMLLEERNRPFRQRISVNYNIEPLNEDETASFIKHRLKVAGATRNYFTADAIRQVYEFSKGFPRLINIICDHAMLSGYSAGIKIVDDSIVDECAKELQISLEADAPTLMDMKEIEYNTASQQLRAGKFIKKIGGSEKWPLLKVAGVLAIIIFLIGFLTSFFKTSQLEQSHHLAKIDGKITIEQSTNGIEKKQPTEIVASKGDTKELLVDKLQSENTKEENNNENIEVVSINYDNGREESKADAMASVEASGDNLSEKESAEKKAPIIEDETPLVQTTHQKQKPQRTDKDPGEINADAVAINQTLGDNLSNTESSVDKQIIMEDVIPIVQISNQNEKPQQTKSEGLQPHFFLHEKRFSVSFKLNSTEVVSNDFETLVKIAEYLSRYPNLIAIVEGYTDSYGNYYYNLKLSQLRANTIKSYFVGQGIAKSRIKVIGLGNENPIGDNENQEGRRKNRRVEIRFELANKSNVTN
jgi:type II secretory pathway predicted ATPase ExeA/outer membrane protein OmpA-like peptidoglycan-associated protein